MLGLKALSRFQYRNERSINYGYATLKTRNYKINTTNCASIQEMTYQFDSTMDKKAKICIFTLFVKSTQKILRHNLIEKLANLSFLQPEMVKKECSVSSNFHLKILRCGVAATIFSVKIRNHTTLSSKAKQCSIAYCMH